MGPQVTHPSVQLDYKSGPRSPPHGIGLWLEQPAAQGNTNAPSSSWRDTGATGPRARRGPQAHAQMRREARRGPRVSGTGASVPAGRGHRAPGVHTLAPPETAGLGVGPSWGTHHYDRCRHSRGGRGCCWVHQSVFLGTSPNPGAHRESPHGNGRGCCLSPRRFRGLGAALRQTLLSLRKLQGCVEPCQKPRSETRYQLGLEMNLD